MLNGHLNQRPAPLRESLCPWGARVNKSYRPGYPRNSKASPATHAIIMHRDIARHLIFLVVVRLLISAAFPAPNPWLRHRPRAFPRGSTGHPAEEPPGDRLTCDVTTFSRPRPPANQRRRPSECVVTEAWCAVPRPAVKAELASDRPARVGGGPGSAGGQQKRRRAHRGRRSRERKRGPRRHHRSWTSSGNLTLKVCGINIQSIKPKTVELHHEIERYNYDFVAVSETWLKATTPS